MIVHCFFCCCIGSLAIGDLNFTSTEHLEPAPLVVAPAALSDRSYRSASDFGTNPFASFDGLYVSSAHNEADNEAQSAPLNQDFVQGASGGKKRKQSHIGSAIEDYVEFKKRQTSKTM